MVLKGRLGLETARIPHGDRHGLLWLERGKLTVQDGTLHFLTAGSSNLDSGSYDIPFQMVSCVLLAPGTTISHDALRLLARHGTGLLVVGEGGVRLYASMPFGPDASALARRQVQLWADEEGRRLQVARRMYAMRLGEVLPASEITILRGIEGARMKETYRLLAQKYGIEWKGRRYDRTNPGASDDANQAINHASTAVCAAAMVAVASTGTIPQLGFIHEDSGISFAVDIADLFRDSVTLPVAFGAIAHVRKTPGDQLERAVRRTAVEEFRRQRLIPSMIDRIKELIHADDGIGNS
jgi:CRISPR-associated protein Cas1